MKKFFLIGYLLVFSGLLSAQSMSDSAFAFIKKNDFNSATGVAGRLIKSDSSDQALKILVDITSKDTTDKHAYVLLGDVYNKMNVYVLALENYRHAEKLDSADADTKFKIADILEKQQQYTAAANKYLQVIAADSNYSKAYINLGKLLYFAKQYPNAAFYLTHYLKFDPKNYNVYLYAANSFYMMRNFPKAAEIASQGLQLFQGKADLEKIAAMSFTEDQKYADAVKILNTMHDSLFTAKEFTRLGKEFQSGKQDSLAIIYYRKALGKDSSLTDLNESIANLYLTSGKYSLAIPYYDKKIRSDSASVSSRVNKALCFIELKNYNDARISLLQAVHLKNDYIPSLLWLARTYRYMDSLQAATGVYRNIINITNNNEENFKSELSEAYGFFGYANLLKKRYKTAIDNLKSSLKFAPENWQYHLWLAQAFALSGKRHAAISEYKQVLTLNPKNPDAIKGLKILGS